MHRFPIRQDQIKNNQATVTGPDCRHIVKVLRLKTGNQIILFDEKGIEHIGIISELGFKEVKVAIAESKTVNRESMLNITLLQGILKGDKMDYVIEKATELGVKKIVPVVTERSQIRDTKRINRWRRITLESSKQSGRTVPPTVLDATNFENALDSDDPSNLQIVFYEKCRDKIKDVINKASKHSINLRLFVGPEGGFTEREISKAKEKGFIPVGLGPRILRTETACIAAITVMQFLYGDI
jgi:16S rRNA (uracil1498-N3)-methyltransferase